MDTVGVIISEKASIIQYMEISGTSIQNRHKVQNCKSFIDCGQLNPHHQQFSNQDQLFFLRYS